MPLMAAPDNGALEPWHSQIRPKVSSDLVDQKLKRICMNDSNSRVLLVEDSKFLRIANERALTKAGFRVSFAADGEEALRIAQAELPDVILLDMLLPKLSGPAVLRKLKESPATSSIPVIVLSALSQMNEEKLIQEGAAAYF